MPRKPSCECGTCRKCKRRADKRAWRAANPDLVREYDARKRAKCKADPERYAAKLAANREYQKLQRAEEPQRVRELARLRMAARAEELAARRSRANATPDRLAELRAKAREYHRTIPVEKRRAQRLAWHAIRKGLIERGACEVCGAERVEAHHDDYAKPLDVRWLCRSHHAEIHRKAA